MSTYQMYREARNAAWRTLLHFSCRELPIDVRGIAEKLRIPVLPFPDSETEPRLYALLNQNPRAIGMSLRIDGLWHIFVREPCAGEYAAFAIAHELGHIILHHETHAVAPKTHAFTGTENEGDLIDDPQTVEDYTADIFAVRLLSPACVLHEMHLDQMGDIARLCRLPRKAAALRAERMEILNERDAFYSEPLEKRVVQQFMPYIRAQAAVSMTADIPPADNALQGSPLPSHRPRLDRTKLLYITLALVAAVLLFLSSRGVFR